ncbi:hypothetical protein OCH239_17270 [Roseivivax halodurans JCM 10272]|uniref:Uncharacterized protein n=1 Tax=Roseivivax halodurans JCM 10272 TaxID=1449350 RepID=X7E9X6_9RHOB|nr:hypothetical protein [Roseivivax halodurans]ETX12762.1 hypothetical protein OCH239_17270 [Roseivivax halodurans JCM 10272]
MRTFFRNLAIVLFAAIIVEQIVLYLVGRSLASDREIATQFVTDVTASGNMVTQTCRQYETALIYSYHVCARSIPGRDYLEIRLTLPAGYLTLIPRDYADRALFDGRLLGFVDEIGAAVESPKQ